MVTKLPLVVRTAYADLLDRAQAAAFDRDFADGNFVSKQVKGRRYWYFETNVDGAFQQKYVGAETPELLARIRTHKQGRIDEKDRARVVSVLLRSHSLPRPDIEIGRVVSALAASGVFRLNAVLVGTVAFQCYPAMLGVRLPGALIQTGDVDIAQARRLSIAVGDRTPPMVDVLRTVDPSFRPVPHLKANKVAAYAAAGGLRVDFLTPNDGPDTDDPEALPALQTDAHPIRFLGFLIDDPVPAVLLHETGVPVLVPAPERYALHKLIVARRRHASSGKRDKDVAQAEALLHVLIDHSPGALKRAWDDCWSRGKRWRQLLGEGLGMIKADIRDRALAAVGASRAVVPGLRLTFPPGGERFDADTLSVRIPGEAAGQAVNCAIARAAIDDHFKPEAVDDAGRVRIVRENRALIEGMLELKYETSPVETPGAVFLTTSDVESLMRKRRRTPRTR